MPDDTTRAAAGKHATGLADAASQDGLEKWIRPFVAFALSLGFVWGFVVSKISGEVFVATYSVVLGFYFAQRAAEKQAQQSAVVNAATTAATIAAVTGTGSGTVPPTTPELPKGPQP